MRTKDLIKILEKLIEDHKVVEDMMGEHEIMIDIFGLQEIENGIKHMFVYKGFSPDVRIEKSDDGVYDVLTAFERK